MKNIILLLLFSLVYITHANSQEEPLNPKNNPADPGLIKSEITSMSWLMVKDSTEIKIGDVQTEIKKEKDKIYVITTVKMKQSPSNWIDSTIVSTSGFKPMYHSSYNQQRDIVLKFRKKKITGYYFDKQTNSKTQISETVKTRFFDSNFYPQLIRLLPLQKGYSDTISIFDYNPKSKIGVITATIKSTEETTIDYNGELKHVWKVDTTDDISNNTTINTYFIEKYTRKLLKQEIDLGDRKMIMK